MRIQRGQTLLEVLFVVALITVALTGFVITATKSVRSSSATSDRSSADKYAQNGMELARQLRDRNWTEFYSYGQTPNPPRCAKSTSPWPIGPCAIDASSIYTRQVVFTWVPSNNSMTVEVTVTWSDEGGSHDSKLTSSMTKI